MQTTANVATYAAAKAALVSLTRSAAIEGREKGIRANAVLPGAIETPMLRTNPNLASGAETLDPADVGSPESVAAAIAFLLSDDAAFVSGEALPRGRRAPRAAVTATGGRPAGPCARPRAGLGGGRRTRAATASRARPA